MLLLVIDASALIRRMTNFTGCCCVLQNEGGGSFADDELEAATIDSSGAIAFLSGIMLFCSGSSSCIYACVARDLLAMFWCVVSRCVGRDGMCNRGNAGVIRERGYRLFSFGFANGESLREELLGAFLVFGVGFLVLIIRIFIFYKWWIGFSCDTRISR